MRHTMASMMLARGVPRPAVSKRLGHASSVTTLTHYVHAIPDDADRLGHVSTTIFEELLGPGLSA
jgi:integrase